MMKPPGGGWTATSVAQEPITMFANSIAAEDGSVHHFALNPQGDLVHHQRSSEGSWTSENLNALSNIGAGFRIGSNPVPIGGPNNTLDVFGTRGEFLIHYYWSPERGWRADNLGNRGRISYEPVVLSGGGEEQHVLSTNESGDLIHFSKLPLPQSLPWHSNWFYSTWAMGSSWDFEYEPRQTIDEGASIAQAGAIADDRVEISCRLFDRDGPPTTGTAARAAVMLHEATHMRYSDTWGAEPHTDQGTSRDNWYYHGLLEGKVLYGGIGGVLVLTPLSLKHSAHQIQIEFLSDIGEFPDYWVPFSVYGSACETANTIMGERIINDPGWRCGEPRPL